MKSSELSKRSTKKQKLLDFDKKIFIEDKDLDDPPKDIIFNIY